MNASKLIYKPYGDRAILMQWPEEIDENLLNEVVFCKKSLESKYAEVILEIISSYSSVLIIYHTAIENFYTTVLALKKCINQLELPKKTEKKLWHIPVCYESELAVDLDAYCKQKKLSKSALVRLHTDVIYTVYFIGFLPGFLYLGGLDKQLHISRKIQPDLKVPKGAVAIGGQQTGIYPQDSPGGWHVIGRCPLLFFEPERVVPCFVEPGDRIKLESVSLQKYNAISSLVDLGVYLPKSEIYEG